LNLGLLKCAVREEEVHAPIQSVAPQLTLRLSCACGVTFQTVTC
jgi:hypothetical protein